MNNSIFIIALIVAIVFFLFKFLEMRFITKKNKPLKYLIRDSILVYLYSYPCGMRRSGYAL